MEQTGLYVGVALATGTQQSGSIDVSDLANGTASSVPNLVGLAWWFNGPSVGQVSHSTATQNSGLRTGLAPGDYTLYAAVEDQSTTETDLIYIEFEVEDLSSGGGLNTINVTDSVVATAASHTVSTALDVADPDAAIAIMSGGDWSNSYTIDDTLLNNAPLFPLFGTTSGFMWAVYVVQPATAGEGQDIDVEVDPPNGERASVVAAAFDNVESVRSSNLSLGALTYEGGDLILSFASGNSSSAPSVSAPWTLIGTAGPSSSERVAIAYKVADGTVSSPSWSNATARAFVALEPTESEVVEGAPAGTVSFDCAVGSDRIIPRNIAYLGEDGAESTTGFHYEYKIGEGSWTDLTPLAPITGQTPGSTISVQVRAVNAEGAGPDGDAQSVRLHLSGHTHGIRRYNPSAAVGHKGWASDVDDASQASTGAMTTGGSDRGLVVAHDVSYGNQQPDEAVHHDWYYDDVQAALVYDMPELSPNDASRLGNGGSQMHLLANPASGSNVLRWEREGAGSRSLWSAAAAFVNVNQDNILGGVYGGQYLTETGQGSSLGPPLTRIDDPNEIYELTEGVPCSLDEAVVVMTGFYARGEWNNDSDPGDRVTMTDWGGENPSGASFRLYDTVQETSLGNLIAPGGAEIIVGLGQGAEGGITLSWFPDSMEPGTPIRMQYQDRWASIVAVAIRPSPNMLHDLTIIAPTADGAQWSVLTDVNHGRVLVAVTPISDDPPTATQIRDEIDDSSSDYSGTFLQLDEIDRESFDPVADLIEGLSEGDYRLSVAPEDWQGRLGTVLHQTWETRGDIEVTLLDFAPVFDSDFNSPVAYSRFMRAFIDASEATGKTLDLLRQTTDGLSTDDAVAWVESRIIHLFDASDVSDTTRLFQAGTETSVTIRDEAAPWDSQASQTLRSATLLDSSLVSDTAERIVRTIRNSSDQASPIDRLSAEVAGLVVRVIQELVLLDDGVRPSAEMHRQWSSSADFNQDILAFGRSYASSFRDHISANDRAIIDTVYIRELQDMVIDLADAQMSESGPKDLSITLADDVEVQDALLKIFPDVYNAAIAGAYMDIRSEGISFDLEV